MLPRPGCTGACASSRTNTSPHRSARRSADRRTGGRTTCRSSRGATCGILRHRDGRQHQHGPQQRNSDTSLPHLNLLLRTPQPQRPAPPLVPER